MFCSPSRLDSGPVGAWVRFWKSLAARRWPWPEERLLWQPDFWDRQLRNDESYGQKWEYVRLNPVRHNLVTRPEAWPYQGELNELRWH
jgi:REP-associated tyrosine transposase